MAKIKRMTIEHLAEIIQKTVAKKEDLEDIRRELRAEIIEVKMDVKQVKSNVQWIRENILESQDTRITHLEADVKEIREALRI